MRNNRKNFQKTVFAAMFLALAYVLPFFTGQIQKIGSMLCPMHIPVLLCGFILGPQFGGAVGFIAPLLRSLTLGMPPLFPSAVCMALELAVYGVASGALYRFLLRNRIRIYATLLSAMLAGRMVWGVAMWICMGIQGASFTLSMFFAKAFSEAIPGIVVQIVLIPVLVYAFERYIGRE